jgi:hypothetical protein
MKYLPFLDGKYSTAPGLTAMAKAEQAEDRLVFQWDDQYDRYIENKRECRDEDIHKYYVTADLRKETEAAVNRHIVQKLITEYPAVFTWEDQQGQHTLHNAHTGEDLQWADDWIAIRRPGYLSLFDGLCGQVQEDMAICQLDGDRDWLAAIHLSAPNHWSPAEKTGKPFGVVHGVVPGMEKLNQQYFKMLVTAVQKGPFFRFAWGLATDTRLNHHPDPRPGFDPAAWQGRSISAEGGQLYLRVERQTINGLPGCNAFLFTIRTYFYPVDELTATEKKALVMAVESMSPESLAYKGFTSSQILSQHL